MSQLCDFPPCPPPPPGRCRQVCPPQSPPSPSRQKPIMRGLHWAQTQRIFSQALTLSLLGGAAFYFLVKRPRAYAYEDYYLKSDFEGHADEMARRGLFQSIPPGSLRDHQSNEK